MDERPARTGATPARDHRDRWILCNIAGAMVIGTAAFLVGRASVDTADCAAAKARAAESHSNILAASALATAEERQRAGREPIRMYGYAVTMNPDCFSASEHEDAQSGLDALTQMGG
nr:hypothetical protein [Streptomyces sp. DSM 41633]